MLKQSEVLSDRNKNTIYVVAYVVNSCKRSISIIHLMKSHAFCLTPRQPIRFSDLDKRLLNRRGLLNKHFC